MLLIALCAVLVIVIGYLVIKLLLIYKSAGEIKTAFEERMKHDTNTLIAISSRDKQIRKLADEMNKQLRILRTERQKYQQGDLELKEAITNIGHDIRTPLTAISGYLNLMEQEPKSENIERYQRIMKERTDTMIELTEELFRYSDYITQGSGQIRMERVSLNQSLEDSISAYYTALKGCNIDPVIEMPSEQIYCNLNKNALSRILGNILNNAIKYSDGDLVIGLDANACFTFSNHASNINQIQVGKLFDRYYTVTTGQKSTGLGLSIAKTLTEKMNGTIHASLQNGYLTITLQFK